MTAQFVPTDEQRAAIETPGNLLIRAGAGSGKTEVLARRFVAMLAGDIDGGAPIAPERMAAIVFGELAAVDLRARIGKVLDERIAATAPGAPRDALRAARRRLPLARISTIHAFCARILRENPLAAKLDPGFAILDEFESATFLEREARRALIDAVRRRDPGARHLAAAYRMDGSDYRAGATASVIDMAGRIARLGHPPEWLVERAQEFAASAPRRRTDLEKAATEVIRLIETLVAAEVGGAAGEKIAASRSRWADAKSALERIAGGGDAGDWELVANFAAGLPAASNQTIKETVKALKGLLPAGGKLTGDLASAWATLGAIATTREVAATIAGIAHALNEARRRDRVVTFDDLLALAYRLLRENPEVANRYRAAIDALMVDEYQDVDPLQDQIVALLATPAGATPPPALFIVGDEKQSIYGFRGADVTVFNRDRDSAPTVLPLRGNRRSTPGIIGFVNALGAALMPPEAERAAWWVRWGPAHELAALRADGFNPPLELITSVADRDAEALAIAWRIRELLDSGAEVYDERAGRPRPARLGDIAILLRAFSDVARYERALGRAGIAYYTVRGRGFFGCAEIADLTELLAAIDDPENSLALAAALRSPLFALSDRCLFDLVYRSGDDGPAALAETFAAAAPPPIGESPEDAAAARAAWTTLRDLRAIRGRATLVALLERALALTDFEAVLLGLERGRQRVANVRKLVELARDFETRSFFSLRDFVAYLRQLAASEPREPVAQILGADADVTRLMTVHQAKGLEFPIVFVADLARPPRPHADALAVSSEHGLLLPATTGAGRFPLPHRELEKHNEEGSDREAAERARLLYVALTRARDRLILSEGKLTKRTSKEAWAKQLRAFLATNEIDVANFAESGEPERAASIAGVSISLRRPAREPLEIPAPARTADDTARAELARIAETRLNFTAPRGGDLIVSPSALEDFARCPRQHYFRRTLELPETAPGAAAGGAGAGAATLGNLAHEILEKIDLTADAAVRDARIARMADTLGEAAGLAPAERIAIARDLQRYLAASDAQVPAEARIDRELPFFMLAGGHDPAIFVRGRIDLLIDDGRRAIVRDYKYARPADGAEKYALAGRCYVLATAAARPEREVTAEIVYLRGAVRRVAIELPPLDQIREQIVAIGRAIAGAARAREWPRGPASARECHRLGCGYISRCWGGD